MSERLEFDQASTRIERGLEALFSARDPEATFVTELEQQLLARVQTAPVRGGKLQFRRPWQQWIRPFSQHRWATAVAGLLLIAAMIVAAIGPQQVLASIQELLGYVPGIGFVDLEATRLLAAPVEATRDGVTLRVEQVIAGPDRTKVVIRSDGLPPEDRLWPDGARQEGDFEPLLRLPDGRTLTTGTWTLRLGGGTLEFPSLPDGVYRLTLELSRLPLVPAGAAPENWHVLLNLQPATGELVAELFPQPYTPANASDTHQGITLQVLELAHDTKETAIWLQVQWPDPDWMFPTIGYFRLPELRDDLGHVYHYAIASSTGSTAQTEVIRTHESADVTPTPVPEPVPEVPNHEFLRTFAPVSPSARTLTLWVDTVGFDVPADASFAVDLGDDPQVGDRWPLDVHLTIAGFPVHISGARLVQEELHLRDGVEQQTALHFDFDPVPDRNGHTLHGVRLLSTSGLGSRGGYDPQSQTIRASLDLGKWPWVPSGPIDVRIEAASILFHGPWTVTWMVPGGEGQEEAQPAAQGAGQVGPSILRVDGARDTRAGLTLQANQVVRTDRVTAVTVELDGAPPGVILNRVLSRNPAEEENGLYLEDNRSRRYERSDGITWRPDPKEASALLALSARPTADDSATLSFQPLDPLSRQATLHVPALELLVVGHVAFDVTVHEGVEMLPREEPPWPASDPWAIDVPLDVGSYHVHLSQAQLEGINNSTSLVFVLEGLADRPDGPWLTGLRPTAIVAPDGRSLDVAYASRFGQAGTIFDLADPDTGAVLPGRYHFELEGITVAVPGPWELRWSLVEP